MRPALTNVHLFTTLGWQDVAARYRRSFIGAFWLTISMAVLIAVIGLTFGTLFGQPVAGFLYHVGIGLVVWGYISAVLLTSCNAFIASKDIILQVSAPLYTHVLRVYWRETTIMAHNLTIIPVMMVFVGTVLHPVMLLALPGLVLVMLNLAWMGLILAVACTRYRDVTQIVQNTLQVTFYLTPVIWGADMIVGRIHPLFLQLNPFHHFLELVRAPLSGLAPSALSWYFALVTAILGWVAALTLYGRHKKSIAYWL